MIPRPRHCSRFACALAVACALFAARPSDAQQPAESPDVRTAQPKSTLLPLLEMRCMKCHGRDGRIEGEVNLTKLRDIDDLKTRPQLLDDLIRVIDSGYMPPEDEAALDGTTRQQVVRELKVVLAAASFADHNAPRTLIRRMTRLQYNNAVQDLFQLSVEVYPLRERMMRDLDGYFRPETGKMPSQVKVASRPLGKFQIIERHLSGATPYPQDLRAEHGFDNRADHLTMSPVLMEAFLRLSRSIVESPEFNSKTCGVWDELFVAPPSRSRDETKIRVRQRLAKFLTKAFRRPAESDQIERYTDYVVSQLDMGEPFENAMKDVAAAALASPRFLYLYDLPTGESSNVLDDYSLASRLSFFLWGSIPDDELHELAAAGRLHEPETLGKQVERMLRDRKLRRFCDSFPSQWLQLERIISAEPDPELFPQFYFAKYRASMHMMLEPLLLFETILVENLSITQLIDSDFSYRSELLDAWYRDGTQGNPGPPTQVVLRRVPVSDRRQGGVITSAAILTMTSGTTRTKPISRGAWLATVILNDPPPPPPGDVPPLADKPAVGQEQLTLRERFTAHREQTACAACHQRIDPLGFALENYDAAGRWREQYENGRPVDASGVLLGKHAFGDIVQFKAALLEEKDRFTRAFAKHLLAYATAREIGVADSSSLDKITDATAAADYRFHTLIQYVVLSDSFRR